MSDQPLVASTDTAGAPAPGYYPDPSVPGFVRYWNGGTWVPGTSRPAPADGEVLVAPAFAGRPAVRPNARYIPPPSVPARPMGPMGPMGPQASVLESGAFEPVGRERLEPEPSPLVETGPVFLDQTSAGAVFMMAPEESTAPGRWQVDPQEQRGLLETGEVARWVSWGAPGEVAEAAGAVDAPEAAWVAAVEPTAVPAPPSGALAPTPVQAPVPVQVQVPVPVHAVASRPVQAPAQAPVLSGSGRLPVPSGAPLPAVRPRKSGGSTSASPTGAPTAVRSPARTPARVARPAAPTPLVTAGLGRRLAARLVDLVAVGAVVAAVAVPLVTSTTAYLQQKLDQARSASHVTGREVQVWLIDGTVLGRAALLLGVLLLVGFAYEVLPTARTGRTLGKRLAGVRVVAGAEAAPGRGVRPLGFGRALVRWLVGQLTVLTVLGPLVPLADRQRRLGWPDRAARTRVVKA
ncbi:RDD family protein [Kitasatospora sp. NBC_01287]|uniref:RDD family protein n=1 Tax=Kitasatospora sp. NBC_01287 TaxID=2903573 RepID=UPI00224F2081|nr:RDD family protein [Kitasatospora sp. NBC_01287]MCX4748764.1 RDD family protein [Kitasatospora sp. NBC_01287]